MRHILPLLLAAVLAAGCSPHFEQVETSVARNGEEIEKVRRDQQLIRQELAEISGILRQDTGTGQESNARILARVGQVERKVDHMLQSLDDNTEFMRTLSARVDMLATRLGLPTVGDFNTMGAAEVGSAPVETLPEEGRAIYQAAMLDRSRGNFAAARDGFAEFLQKYGRTELADDALYWLGELDYGDGRYAEAADSFRRLLAEHPGAERTPDAMLKLGLSQIAADDVDAGRATLEQLIAAYPGTEEAALAEERLGAAAGSAGGEAD